MEIAIESRPIDPIAIVSINGYVRLPKGVVAYS